MRIGSNTDGSAALDLNGPADVPFHPLEADWVERPAFELFREQARAFPDRVASDDGTSSLTYGQVLAGAEGLARELRPEREAGQAVGVLLPNDANYPVAVLGCLAAARPCVMLDRHHPAARIAAIIRDAGLSTIVLTRADLEAGYLLPAGMRIVVIDDALVPGTEASATPIAPASPDAASFVVYTSGSTGQPKGIVLSQRSVLHRAAELITTVHLGPDDKVLSLASPSTIGGLQQIFEAMLAGATLFKLDLQRLSLERVLEIVAARGITMMFSTPAVWRAVARIDGARRSLAGLRCIQTSGDVLLRVDLEAVRTVLPATCHVLSVYGATEAPALLQWFVPEQVPDEETRVPVGYPLPGISLSIVDESGAICGDGQPGELVVRSRWTALGLWRDGKVGAGSFKFDSPDSAVRTYRTGDLARRRHDGLFVILGRQDRQIKIRGNRVELADIETAMQRAPFVADAAVVARRLDAEPQLLAFVVPRTVGQDIADATRAVLREALPAHMRPTRLFTIDEMPLLPGRKVDEAALLRIADARSPVQIGRGPAGSGERASERATDMVSRAWRRTLGSRPPPSDETFDQVSGDSLRLLQLVFHLERLAGRSLPLERFHGEMRPSEFALELDRQLAPALVARDSGKPVVFFMPGYGGDEPRLGRFRAACANMLDIRPLHYPALPRLADADASFDSISAHVADQIDRAQPEGPVALAGYSVGGDVAYCAALRLVERGRAVGLLAIFDTDTGGDAPPTAAAVPRSIWQRLGRLVPIVRRGDWNELIAGLFPAGRVVRPPLVHIVRGLAGFRRIGTANLTFYLKRHLHEAFVQAHHSAWLSLGVVRRVAAPIVLFRSQQEGRTTDDLGWRSRADRLTVVDVPGNHLTMFGPNEVDELASAFHREVVLRR
jgi:amino acid adenylation domain-containing protein